jgi:hypothetical protein
VCIYPQLWRWIAYAGPEERLGISGRRGLKSNDGTNRAATLDTLGPSASLPFLLSFVICTAYAIVRLVLKPAYCSRPCVLIILLQHCIAGNQTEVERYCSPKSQTSPRPPIATVSHRALTVSSHTAPSSPRRACTPLNRLRTSSTALVRAAPAPVPATTTPAAAAAAAAAEREMDFGRRRSDRRSMASAGSTTQRRTSGAYRMYGLSTARSDSTRDGALLPPGTVVAARVSTCHVGVSLRWATGSCAPPPAPSRRCG